MNTRDQTTRVLEALRAVDEYPGRLKPIEPPPPSYSIALSREAGSGGEAVAAEVGRRLSWPVYDRELLNQVADELKVDAIHLEGVDERPGSRLVECLQAFASSSSVSEVAYFRRLLKLVLGLGARGACVVVGRGAMIALPPETTLRVRVVASREQRLAAIMAERGEDRAAAARYLDARDRERRQFIKDHFHKDLSDPLLYDVVVNGSRFSVDDCAAIVIESLARMQARKVGG